MSKFAIKHDNGTFFRRMTAIGPAFGGTEENAQTFDSPMEATSFMACGGWKFFDAEVVELPTKEQPHEAIR